MSGRWAGAAGAAISWQAVQHFGVKVIYLARLVILARLLAPQDFGLLAIAVVAVDFLTQITEIGMIPALVQRPEVRGEHYDTAWTVGLVRALAVGLVVAVGAPLIAGFFAEPQATNVIRLLALRPLLQAVASIRVADLTRRLRFRELALLQLLEALTTAIVSIALASRLGVWALVAGSLAGPALYAAASYLLTRHRPRLLWRRSAAAALVRFGRWIFLSSLVAVAGRAILQIAISRRLGVTELGLYFLAAKLAFLPSSAATDIVGSVAFPIYARIQDDVRRAASVFRTHLMGTCLALLPVYGMLLALAPTLTEEILGPKWAGTAPVIRILGVAALIGFLGDIAVPILHGFGRPGKVTLLEVVQSALLIGFVWELAGRFGLPGAAAAWLPALVVSQIIALVFLRRLLDSPFVGLGGPALVIAGVAALGAWIALRVDAGLPGLAGLVLAAMAATAAMGALLFVADRRLDLGLGRAMVPLFPKLSHLFGHARPNGEPG